MSKLTELIEELCPDGVEYRPLGELGKRNKGMVITASRMKELHHEGGEVRIFAGGYTIADVDRDDLPGEAVIDVPSIIVKSRGNIGFEYHTRPFTHKNELWSYTLDDPDVDQKFIFYYLQSRVSYFQLKAKSGKLPQIGVRDTDQFSVPTPPLKVQREIVRVLDAFTDLEQNLVSELELRKKQLDHYRSQVLSADSSDGDLVELGELGRIVTGRTPKGDDPNAWGSEVNFVTPSDIGDGVKMVSSTNRQLSAAGAQSLMKSFVPAGSILVTCIGVVGKTVINDHDCVTNQQINSIILNPNVNADYVFHALTALRPQLSALGSRSTGTMPILNKTNFSRIKISLPSITRQNEIAETLNKFDALISTSGSGIQAEIDLRRQQYEFYRDELLSFTPKED